MVAFADQTGVIWQQVCEGQAHSVNVFCTFEAGIQWHFIETICKPIYRHAEPVLSLFFSSIQVLFTCLHVFATQAHLKSYMCLSSFSYSWMFAWQTGVQLLEGLTLKLFLNQLQEVDIFPSTERSDFNRRDYKHDLCQSVNQSRS